MKSLQKSIIISASAWLTLAACGSDLTASSTTPAPSKTIDTAAPLATTGTTTPATTMPATTTVPKGESSGTEALLVGLLESHGTAGEFVGARIAFRDRDGTVTEVAAGTDTIGPTAKPVSLDVPWGIGSITKVFVAVSVLQLVDEGRIGLDAHIDTYFPDLPGAAIITIRDLLQHTSGLNEYDGQPEIKNGGTRAWSPGELVAIAEAQGRVGAPGAGYNYSNTNYILLGEIIRQVTGNSWLDEVTTRISEPLGMDSTGIIDPANVAAGHTLIDATFEVKVLLDPSTGGSAGALESTGRDLLAFTDALHRGRLLSPESQKAMESFIPGEDLSAFGVTHSYGLGLERYQNESITILGHLGGSDAWGAFIGFDRRSGNAVAVAINSNNAGPQAVIALEALVASAAA
jgi:D-alanyl-D-alanine carboxypeptidase